MKVTEYKSFFNRYRKFKSESNEIRIERLETIGSAFFKNLRKIKKNYEKENELNAFGFNVFSILNFKKPEEDLHSPILSELLNVKGSHGQKDLFYKEFLKMLRPENDFISKFTNLDLNEYSIETEAFIKTSRGRSGRIDIEVKSLNPKKKFVIIIENKWNSLDSGFDQITKYYQSRIQQGFTDSNIVLVYLTKKGAEPDRKYISEDFQKIMELKKGETYFPIKYSVEIRDWLMSSIEKIKAERIKDLLRQYINTLE